jgi:hypothetical protein
MSQEQWDFICSDPIAAGRVKLQVAGLPQPRSSLATAEEYVAWAEETPRDLNEHVRKLYELSSQCSHATEITHRRESTVGLLGAKKIVSYNAESDALLPRLAMKFPLILTPYSLNSPLPPIEETDMLFLDTIHTAMRLYAELTTYHTKVRRWIVMHDTQLYRETGEPIDGKETPGLLVALRRFMKEFPQWSVLYHTDKQYGLTVIGKLDKDKPKLPGLIEMADNFTQFLAEYARSGMESVSKADLEKRLETCSICDQRSNNRCAVCGCGLAAKASATVSECPLGKWSVLSDKQTV